MVSIPDEKEFERFNDAIRFAVDMHTGQFRKGSHVPYILHPMEVMTILMSMDADADLLMAGVLHDTIEDTPATASDIETRFGPRVAELVLAHTEDKSRSWNDRKAKNIETLRTAEFDVRCLIMADMLSNLRTMARDHEMNGEVFWERFSAPREKQHRYYTAMLNAIADLAGDKRTARCRRESKLLYDRVFSPIE